MDREQQSFAPTRRSLGALMLAGAATSLPAMAGAAAVAPEPDADLIALGARYREADRLLDAAIDLDEAIRLGRVRPVDEAARAARDEVDRLSSICNAMRVVLVKTRATTLPGLMAKASATLSTATTLASIEGDMLKDIEEDGTAGADLVELSVAIDLAYMAGIASA